MNIIIIFTGINSNLIYLLMRTYLLLLLLLTSALMSKAQNRSNLTGKVVDSLSTAPVELATVAVLNPKDTLNSLVSYTLTDKSGVFTLHNLPAGIGLKLLITFVGYKPYRKMLTLVKGASIDLGTIILNPRQLKEISITGERAPIVIKKDTIEFNTEAFKTRPNAVVEELLKKLPGVEVDNSGNIKVNGKEISKIKIDGKEFFTNDPKIASKNLDAALIDKVQIYDDRENDPDHLIPDSKVNKIINLKFKRALKKSTFGKVFGGGGTGSRYESGALFNSFRDTLQVSFIGVANNLNKTGFSRQELYSEGGFSRGGDNILNGGGASLGGEGYGGIQSVATAGVNINNDYGKKLQLNLIYFLSYTKNNYDGKANRQQFLGDTILTSNATSDYHNANTKHNISSTIKWRPDTSTEVNYNPTLNISNSSSGGASSTFNSGNFVPKISTNNGENSGLGGHTQFQHYMSYYHSFKKKGESIYLSHNLAINPDMSDGYNLNQLISYTSALPSTTLNRYSNNTSKNSTVGLSATYRYPITKKFTLSLSTTGNYNRQGGNKLTYDFNPAANQYNIYLDSLRSNLNRYTRTGNIVPGFTYHISKTIELEGGLSNEWEQINNQFSKNLPDLNQNYYFLLPNFRLGIGNFSLNYDASIQQPSINDLQPIKYVYSPVYTWTGNPNLQPTKRNNFSAYYYTYKPETQISLNFYSGFTLEENSIYQRRTINGVGAQTSFPINRDGQYNGYGGISMNKKFKKAHDLTFSMNTNFYGYANHQFFQLNQDEGFQDNYYLSATEHFSLNWKDKIDIDPSYSIRRNITHYTGVNYDNVATTTHSVNTHFTAHLPAKLDIESSYSYTYNPLVSPGYQRSINLFSASIAHQMLKKDRGEIKLSCYDIFNQNVSSYRYASQNSITDTQTEIVKRYFLLTLLFKFNKTITK
jgi:hypothetical protein